jgi:hypothetical protein
MTFRPLIPWIDDRFTSASETLMRKTMALRFISVALAFVAGVSGCSSQPQGTLPDLPESTSTVETTPHTGTAQNIDTTSSTDTTGINKARTVNPRVARFAELDTDQDGVLSLSEFSVGRTSKDATKWFERRDADHDGLLSLAEFVPQSAAAAGGKPTEEQRSGNDRPPIDSLDQ